MAEPVDPLVRWKERKEAAQRDRQQYHRQWQINQHFAAGLQWLRREKRSGRVFHITHDAEGRPYQTADVLDQYLKTAIGKVGGTDFKPELLSLHDDALTEEYAREMNDAWQWGWENEWKGDKKAAQMLRILGVLGTGAIRVRYDRSVGPVIAGGVPHAQGKPILDPEQARQYVADRQQFGLTADIRDVREGKVCWEVLSPWNLLPQPGIEDPDDFTWEIVVRPVELTVLQAMYPKAADWKAEPIDTTGQIGLNAARDADAMSPATVGKLDNHVLVYTGYGKPCPLYPDGETIVFADQGMLGFDETLPRGNEPQDPYGPRSGITYFRWSIIPGRFWAKSFIEPGIGPQTTRNKRVTQIDATIDHGQPVRFYEEGSVDPEQIKGRPGEWVRVRQGGQPPRTDGGVAPGAWMQGDIQLQDANVEKALGLHDVSIGKSASASAPYARIAAEGENDVVKLGPIADDFKANLAEVGRDTFDCMREWPSQKRMLLSGDDQEGELRAAVFNANRLPAVYKVRQAQGSGVRRNTSAELQKISDIMQQAVQSTAVQQDPAAWVEWYKESLEAEQALPLPTSEMREVQQRKAEVENHVMSMSGQPAPVQPYDDHQLHDQIHTEAQIALDERLILGDPAALAEWQVIEQHKQLHGQQQMVQMVNQQLAQVQQQLQPQPPGGAPGGGNVIPFPAPRPPAPPPTG